MKKLILLLIVCGFIIETTHAQSAWLSDSRLSSVGLEWDKPLFDDRTIDQDQVTAASSALFLTGRIKVADNFRFIAELPVSHFGYEANNPFGGDDNSTVLGNIYLGSIWDLNTNNPNNHAFLELGVRIPTTPDPNDDRFGSASGIVSESSDRMEAFLADTWSVPLVGNFITSVGGPFAVKGRLGTVYNIYTDDINDFDNAMWLLYGITALYRDPGFEAHAGFSGRNQYVGNVSGSDFGDTGFTQLRAGIAVPFQNITPGIYVRKPLGENYNQLLDLAYGVTLEIRRR